MKDYYSEFIAENLGKTSETEVSKVSKGIETDGNGAFDTFDTEQTEGNPRIFSLDDLLKDSELREQFEFEIAERTAIMIFDGKMPEADAIDAARADIKKIWIDLFS